MSQKKEKRTHQGTNNTKRIRLTVNVLANLLTNKKNAKTQRCGFMLGISSKLVQVRGDNS